jgi:phosphate transport system substrate-binding protein
LFQKIGFRCQVSGKEDAITHPGHRHPKPDTPKKDKTLKINPFVFLWISISLVMANSADARITIDTRGSDTLMIVAQVWAEEYHKHHPKVAVSVNGGGSGVGIAALINGTVDIANASRKIKPKEIKMAERQGFHPVEVVVGQDALTIYVHKKNPITSLSLSQLAEINAEEGSIVKWSQLGITVPGCKDQEILRISRQSSSGTYYHYRKTILGKSQDFKLGSFDMHGSKDVVTLVEKTPCAIGYSGLAYATSDVKLVCISETEEGPCIPPSIDTANDRTYPISRPLYMYTRGKLTGEIKKYIDWVRSDVGQCLLLKCGYAPLREIKCE